MLFLADEKTEGEKQGECFFYLEFMFWVVGNVGVVVVFH